MPVVSVLHRSRSADARVLRMYKRIKAAILTATGLPVKNSMLRMTRSINDSLTNAPALLHVDPWTANRCAPRFYGDSAHRCNGRRPFNAYSCFLVLRRVARGEQFALTPRLRNDDSNKPWGTMNFLLLLLRCRVAPRASGTVK